MCRQQQDASIDGSSAVIHDKEAGKDFTILRFLCRVKMPTAFNDEANTRSEILLVR